MSTQGRPTRGMLSLFPSRIGGGMKLILGLAALACVAALCACSKPATNVAASNSAPPAVAVPTNAAPAPQAEAAGPDAAAAKAFLEGLYAHYKTEPAKSSWAPMDKNDAEVFDADMVRLLAKDMQAAKGEVGAIDGDYICSCQDWEPFNATITIVSATPTTAKANADFRVFKTDPPRHLEYDLVKQNGAWR